MSTATLPRRKWNRLKIPEPLPKKEVRQSRQKFINETPVLYKERIRLLEDEEGSGSGLPALQNESKVVGDTGEGTIVESEFDSTTSLIKDADKDPFSRSSLRTPPEVRRNILLNISSDSVQDKREASGVQLYPP